MPKVTIVEKARKAPGSCGRCGSKIEPGQPYKHWSFRYGGKHIRCTKSECAPRASDLTSNDKLSTLYAAGENFDDSVVDWDGEDGDDLKSMLQEYADEVRSVAEMYEESAQNIEDGFQHETSQSEEQRGYAEELNSFADDIEAIQYDIDDWNEEDARAEVLMELSLDEVETLTADQEEDVKNALDEKKQEWVESARETAADASSTCPL